MKQLLTLFTFGLVITGCASAPSPSSLDQDDNVMFMGMDLLSGNSDDKKKDNLESNKNTISSTQQSIEKEIKVDIRPAKDELAINMKQGENIKLWVLNGVAELRAGNFDAILKQVPESERSQLSDILDKINLDDMPEYTIQDNLIFMDAEDEKFTVKQTIEMDETNIEEDSKIAVKKVVVVEKSNDVQSMSAIIIDLIKTANLSDADKDLIIQALKE